MKTIPTAEEYLKNSDTYEEDYSNISLWDAEQRMIEFAKLHVKKALKEASEKAKTEYDCNNWNCCGESINKNSILNSYPLDKIK